MSSELKTSFEAWTTELNVGVPADKVLVTIVNSLAERLVKDIYDYDPDTIDLETILEEAEDHKRNPMLTLGEEISVILNDMDSTAILKAVESLENFQEMVDEFEGDDDDDEPDYPMMAGDALVEEAMTLVHDIWPDRREGLAATGPKP